MAAIMTFAVSTLDADPGNVIIIAHRGASGYRPEHTIEAYTLAIEMGADFIEPDLVVTKDGVLIARHENEIGDTTDVEARFPSRRTSKVIDGRSRTGWFAEDFTLAEIRSLRARERLPFRSHVYDGRFHIPTFDEVVTLVEQKSRELRRTIGVYPETKHPGHFRKLGLSLEDRLLEVLRNHGKNTVDAAVFIQSFEPSSLRILQPLTPVNLIQLLDEGADISPARLSEIAEYADGVGVNTRLILPANPDGTLRPPTTLVKDAHQLDLVVHAWTLRSEPVFLPRVYRNDPGKEYEQLAGLGVDGIFGDFPDVAFRALRKAAASQ